MFEELEEYLTLLPIQEKYDIYETGGNSSIYNGKYLDVDIFIKIQDMILSRDTYEIFKSEFKIYQRCNQLKGTVHIIGYSLSKIYLDTYNVFLYMKNETMYDLEKYIANVKNWSCITRDYILKDNLKKQISLNMCKTLEELNNANIIHCDYKSQNIVVDDNQNVKIIDFEAATFQSVNTKISNCIPNIGTPGYMPPEMIDGICSNKSDIYSLGVCLIELWNGKLWRSDSDDYEESRNDVLLALRQIKYHYPKLGKILTRCISRNKDKRPMIKTIMKYIELY